MTSTTVNRQLDQVIIKDDPFYSESNMQALKASTQQIKEGKTVTKTMEELDAMVNA